MKKIFLFCVLPLWAGLAQAQSHKSCCSRPSETTFAMLTARADFRNAHVAPEPFTYIPQAGTMLTYATPDGKTAQAFAVKSDKKTKKVLIVVHEWWGLNDYIKQEAENWKKDLGDVDVYAVDLYDGKVANDPNTAGQLMGGLNAERAVAIVQGLLNTLDPDAQVATIGWCMGGSWSFQTALLAGNKTKGCVMYYGFPEKDKEKMKPLASDVLFIQATQDGFIKNEDVTAFAENLKSVGKKITIKPFAADHAFANPSNPKHQPAFTKEAHAISLAYLLNALGLKK